MPGIVLDSRRTHRIIPACWGLLAWWPPDYHDTKFSTVKSKREKPALSGAAGKSSLEEVTYE